MWPMATPVPTCPDAVYRDAFDRDPWGKGAEQEASPGRGDRNGTAFSVSQSKLAQVKAYLAKQEEHHRRRTYQEEVVALLKRHGVEFDPRFVV